MFFFIFLEFSLIFFDFLRFSLIFKAVCQAVWPAWHWKSIDFVPVQPRDGLGTIYYPRVSAVWPGPHALTTRVKRCEPANTGFRRCGPGHTNQGCLSSRVACVEVLLVTGQPRRFRDDFTLQKALNVLPGPHTLTTRVTMCGTGHTGFRRCGQCHILEGCLSNGVAGAAFRANLEGPRGHNPI